MKILLLTPLPRLANELCDVLRLFGPLEAFAVQATAPLSAHDAAKAQFTAANPTPDMEPLRHTFTEADGLWRCAFTLRGQTAERTLPVPAESAAGEEALHRAPSAERDGSAAAAMPTGPAQESRVTAAVNADNSAGLPGNAPESGTRDEASQSDGAPAPANDGSPAACDPAESLEALLRRRLQKRLCKLTLYDLCKALTGHRPPWGSLTGIRPTRLVYEGLARGLTLAQSTQALSDTFDVSPDKAALLGRIVAVQQTLPAPHLDEADVYVSIPFCRTRCAYCSFPGEALGRGLRVQPYLDALLWEMEQTAALMATRGLRLRALYIGGGTPTALPPEAFARLLQHTALCFAAPREFTVEAGRPDTITPAHLRTLRAHGVTRISVNPQTMNDETLRRIGRDHTAAQTEEAFALARAHGFTHINMDVIAGLPGETPADFDRTLARVRALGPDSLTVHTLAIKRSSRLHLEGATLPDAAAVAAMVEAGEAAAAALGLEPYYLYRQKYMAGQQQNVGYARPGFACLYNVDIMEENTSILACGAGAISKRVFADRELRIERAPNVSDVDTYLARVSEMAARKQALFA